MLTTEYIAAVRSTIAFLETGVTAITEHFHLRMFKYNPEFKNIYNMK